MFDLGARLRAARQGRAVGGGEAGPLNPRQGSGVSGQAWKPGQRPGGGVAGWLGRLSQDRYISKITRRPN